MMKKSYSDSNLWDKKVISILIISSIIIIYLVLIRFRIIESNHLNSTSHSVEILKMKTSASIFILVFMIYSGFVGIITVNSASSDEPLYLTSYIEKGALEEAREASRVVSEIFGNVTSFSGFFTVNKTYDKNMFMWFFPASEKPEENPLMLWLQGGPGLTSLFGLFAEIGPFELSNSELIPRNYSWTRTHSLLFIDNPVDTGYSFTKTGGMAHDETQVGEELYEALRQFFVLFPEYRQRDFYVAGESYAGKYVPVISHKIYKQNQQLPDSSKINLKGLAIGNGWLDPVNQMDIGEYAYQHGLVDFNTKEMMDKCKNESKILLEQGNFTASTLIQREISTILKNATGFSNMYNYLIPESQNTEDQVKVFVEDWRVRKAIHVGNLTFNNDDPVDQALLGDIMVSEADFLVDLLEEFRVLIYSGQLDLAVPYPTTVNYLRKLKFNCADQYNSAERKIWYLNDKIVGYVKSAGNLTEILIRNAGHLVPSDQPEVAFDMINTFTRNENY